MVMRKPWMKDRRKWTFSEYRNLCSLHFSMFIVTLVFKLWEVSMKSKILHHIIFSQQIVLTDFSTLLRHSKQNEAHIKQNPFRLSTWYKAVRDENILMFYTSEKIFWGLMRQKSIFGKDVASEVEHQSFI